jgi:hypothetical protein
MRSTFCLRIAQGGAARAQSYVGGRRDKEGGLDAVIHAAKGVFVGFAG